ncbi:MAG: hypothetical protein GXZ11_06695 [Tissierellia bacterium]|nr:hypothetical protein [Tissierellia bacterium]
MFYFKRDFWTIKWMNIALALIPIFTGMASLLEDNPKSQLVGFFTMGIYTILLNRFSQANRMVNREDILFNSLPNSRFSIVRGRYISVLIYLMAFPILVMITELVTKTVMGAPFVLQLEIFAIYLIMGILSSAFFIVLEFVDPRKAAILYMVLYFAIILTPNVMFKYLPEEYLFKFIELLNKFGNTSIAISLGLVIATLAIYLISMGISFSIYKKKEF